MTTDGDGRVTELNLSDNDLFGKLAAALGELAKLEFPYLGKNQLSGCVPAALRDVSYSYVGNLGLSFCQ